ncbi:MAG TPA: HAD family hydrolase [Chloroflexia bacterium]|nr:HAD family hydrolase [Chloroflexia bacterium]
MRPYKALCLDLDDTLLDGSHFAASIERTCRELTAVRPTLDAARLLAANREVWRTYGPEMEEKWNLDSSDGAWIGLEAWRRTLRACGCDDESLARHAQQLHWQYGRETYRLFEEAEELLTTLRAAGVPLSIITNGAADFQREKVRLLGIEHLFDAVIISGEVGIAKPDAAIFALAMEQMGVEPAGVWHVGDNLVTDVGGARAAGIGSVWINRRERPLLDGDIRPDLEIRSLSDLRSLIAK